MIDPVVMPRRRAIGAVPVAELDQLEREITLVKGAQPVPDLERLGQMSAEAVMKQYEAAAAAFEAMGNEVNDRITKLQQSLDDAAASLKLIAEAADAIRDKGKLAHMQIEEMSSVSRTIRELCDDATKRISGGG